MRRQILAAIMLIAAAVLWTQTLLRAETLMNAYSGVSVRMSDSAVTAKQLKKILPSEEADGLIMSAAWTRSDPLTAEAASMQTSTALCVVAVYGDMRQTEPLMTLLSGSIPAEDDADGCLIDAQSALALFHSTEPIGARLSVAGRAYTVRGIVKTYAPALFVHDADAAYENLEFLAGDVSSGGIRAKAYVSRYALSGDYSVIQRGLYARILRGLAFLPAALLLLGLAALAARAARARRKNPGRAVLLALAAAGLAALGVLLLIKTLYWPQNLLPTKASDFAFWRTLTESWKETWKSISLLSPLPGDISFFRGMRACVWQTAVLLLLEAAAACTAFLHMQNPDRLGGGKTGICA